MAEEISYTVLCHNGQGWRAEGASRNMQTALSAAEKLFASKKYEQVKVDKSYTESRTGRTVQALAAGLVSFVLTLAILRG